MRAEGTLDSFVRSMRLFLLSPDAVKYTMSSQKDDFAMMAMTSSTVWHEVGKVELGTKDWTAFNKSTSRGTGFMAKDW